MHINLDEEVLELEVEHGHHYFYIDFSSFEETGNITVMIGDNERYPEPDKICSIDFTSLEQFDLWLDLLLKARKKLEPEKL